MRTGKRVSAIVIISRGLPGIQRFSFVLIERVPNYQGPHHRDVPLAEIIGTAFTVRPATISFEAANPRRAHEWTLFEQVKLPEGKIIIPGVIESKSNFIEHPELIAQRIARGLGFRDYDECVQYIRQSNSIKIRSEWR